MPRTTQGWESYGSAAGLPITLTSEATSAGSRLDKHSSRLVSSSVDLRILDISSDGTLNSRSEAFLSSADVEAQLPKLDNKKSRVRIISLHSYQSPQPLEITKPLLRKILRYHNVDLGFLEVLFSFGQPPNKTESGASHWSSNLDSNGSRKLSYQLQYVEENPRPGKQRFSPRQTGVYHHSCKTEDFDLFILLHPTEDSLLEEQILKIAQDQRAARIFAEKPMRLHLLAYELYIGNWRWYLQDLGEELDRKNDRIMIVDLDTYVAVSSNFDKVQALRNLRDKTLALNGHCTSAKAVLEKLVAISNDAFIDGWDAEQYLNRLSGYSACIPALTARVQNSIELHAYALDLKNQFTAADMNQHVETIAEETRRDTTSVKWITYLTLIYLPWSFTATLYGMNVFWFNQQTRRLAVSQDIWIWVATALPLTGLTIGCYRFLNEYLKSKPVTDKLPPERIGEKSISGP